MSRLSRSAKAIAVVAGLVAPPALAAPVALSDAQLNAVPAGIRFSITNRVADQPGIAPVTDNLLVNPWGLSQAPGGFLWTSNNGTNTSTLYDPNTFAKNPLVVNVGGGPTGTTFVGLPNAFKLSQANNSNTIFAFATEGGQILGWNPNVALHDTVLGADQSKQGAVFKGLTLGMKGQTPLLFATDFAHGVVKAFDTGFTQVMSFTDPFLPPNFVPFNVQNLNGLLYVTYAFRQPGADDETAGRGLGFVDVFDTSGHFLRRLASRGELNAPWGLAIAPQSFGKFAGALLVGNFGDGQVNAYDPVTGRHLGRLGGLGSGIEGLWALRTGPNGTITFSAGPGDETHGRLGSIAPVTPTWASAEVASLAEMHR